MGETQCGWRGTREVLGEFWGWERKGRSQRRLEKEGTSSTWRGRGLDASEGQFLLRAGQQAWGG